MLTQMLARMFGVKPLAVAIDSSLDDTRTKKEDHPLGKIVKDGFEGPTSMDPLAHVGKGAATWDNQELIPASAFSVARTQPNVGPRGYVGDSMYSGNGGAMVGKSHNAYSVPEALQSWYSSQSFIGHQACAIIAQQWLVDKACTMPGQDATRNGYEITLKDSDEHHPDETGFSSEEIIAQMGDLDNDFDVTGEMIEFWRFCQVYGVRICVYDVEYEDPKAIENPFNIDGVRKGSYKGMRQVDPYWCMPQVGNGETVDPASPDFYDPQFWMIGGKKYHRSHLTIGRGPQPADILKPTYVFGGIPLVQRIYERVYAAERTANEGPMLALTKRTSVLKADLTLAEAQPERFWAQIATWVGTRDNYGIKVINTDDAVEQHDTSLSDLDGVIMNQYQLVAAIASVPATKLMGTSPKGFNSTGEFETISYHEHLESVQKFLSNFLRRHHQLLAKSTFGVDLPINHTWKRVGSMSEQQLADLNAKKGETGERYINGGVISPDEERNRLKNDPLSGYGHLEDVPASTEMGASPENEQGEVDAMAKETTAEAKVAQAESPDQQLSTDVDTEQLYADVSGLLDKVRTGINPEIPQEQLAAVSALLDNMEGLLPSASDNQELLTHVAQQLDAVLATGSMYTGDRVRSTKPSVGRTATPSVQRRIGDDNQVGLPEKGGKNFSHRAMPERKVGHLLCRIENPKGSIRSGVAKDGTFWSNQMPGDYGFIENTKGADGDEVDVMIGPDTDRTWAYVINQIEPTTGEFDEHKVYIGYANEGDARAAYKSAYQVGWDGLDSVYRVRLDELRDWLFAGPCTTPYL